MPEAQTPEAYVQVAEERLEDARTLLNEGRYAGAFYLCGYGVECGLKALLLERSTAARRLGLRKSFRGKLGHDLEWIKKKLRDRGTSVPRHLARAFASVNTWSTTLRYDTAARTRHEAASLLRNVELIAHWVKGEL
jgi:HEPN domain-containing protein